MGSLQEICDFLTSQGVSAEVMHNRKEPYVNVGDVKHVVSRMQFWPQERSGEIHVYIGKEMGKWFEQSSKLPYLNSRYRHSDIENKIEFPNYDEMCRFVKETVAR